MNEADESAKEVARYAGGEALSGIDVTKLSRDPAYIEAPKYETARHLGGEIAQYGYETGRDTLLTSGAVKVVGVAAGELKAVGKEVKALAAEEKAAARTAAAEARLGRSGALNKVKRDLGIPSSQHPDGNPRRVPLTRSDGSKVLGPDGKPVMTREYTYTRPDGSKVIIQEHSIGHGYGDGQPADQPHFNVRPPEDPRHGTVPDAQEHYPFER